MIDTGAAVLTDIDRTTLLSGDGTAGRTLLAGVGHPVADTTARTLWVSAGPQLSGRFVRLDLTALFGDAATASAASPGFPEDPVLVDGRYERGRSRARSGEAARP